MLQFVLDFIERFLAEVAILQHFSLGLLGKLPDRGDVRIVQAIRCTHTQLDLVDTHVEELLQLDIFFAHASWRLIEFDHFLVVVDEYVEVMPNNRGSLEQRVIGSESAVGPDLQNEFVIIGTLTDPGVFDRILNARDW